MPLFSRICSVVGHLLAGLCRTKAGRDAVRRRWRMRGVCHASKRVRGLHEKTLSRVRRKVAKGNRLGLAFLVTQRAKWNVALWRVFATHGAFKVRIFLLRGIHGVADEELADGLRFFRGFDSNAEVVSVEGLDEALRLVGVDVVFVQEPFLGISRMLGLSRFALPCYVHYTISLRDTAAYYYTGEFVGMLWRFFCESEDSRRKILRYSPLSDGAVIPVGWPKLDVYREPAKSMDACWKPGGYRAIYAPSFSFCGFGAHGRFDVMWRGMIELAESAEGIGWVFMPHPALASQVVRTGLMSESGWLAYLERWRRIGAVWTDGDYFDLLRSSNCLVTDGESFLAEYLPSGAPVIDLNRESEVPYSEFGQRLRATYYAAASVEDVRERLASLMRGEDPKLGERLALREWFVPAGQYASEAVLEGLLKAVAN